MGKDLEMENEIYSIELLCQGKYESWDFESETKRNWFFEKVKKEFAGHEIHENEEDVDDSKIAQLSATNLQIKSDGVSQVVPYVWYEANLFEEMLEFINRKYEQKHSH
ncbi:hypothetical protein ACSFXN_10165 [Planococcus sp. 1R117A]|uniref:hypothetical protein n=1 Tax=Planococcus sp. 1R117A TaxID=3447020 RepID=UPI003EDB81FA